MLTPNSVEVTWDESPDYDVIGYLISCTSPASYAGNKNVIVNGGDATNQEITNLVENTPYAITVQGLTKDGRKSPCSDEVSVKTSTAGKWYICKVISYQCTNNELHSSQLTTTGHQYNQ